jgi:hypothetical protein
MPSAVKQTTTFYMPESGLALSRADGGSPLTLSTDEIVRLVRENTSGVPVGFFVGTIERESGGKWNQIDLDYDKDTGEAKIGEETYGLCMVRKSELVRALSLGAVSDAAALDPATNLSAFSRVMNTNMAKLSAAAGARGESPSEFDLMCYMAWAHNAGIGSAVRSVSAYGLDWNAAKARPQNAWFTSRLIPYAEHIARRCADFTSVTDAGEHVAEQGTGTDTGGLRVAVLLAGAWLAYRWFAGLPIV